MTNNYQTESYALKSNRNQLLLNNFCVFGIQMSCFMFFCRESYNQKSVMFLTFALIQAMISTMFVLRNEICIAFHHKLQSYLFHYTCFIILIKCIGYAYAKNFDIFPYFVQEPDYALILVVQFYYTDCVRDYFKQKLYFTTQKTWRFF
ncbi:unnamed protein product [Caenorhabditis angaria]|uniref:Uncharacterized protein n=1 Tax=Caenorhabditis angaria TaxID=860376 RepID=A0A9P1IE57_9PELO|nr:unnamed protein product [Caenorhabditis angaria]